MWAIDRINDQFIFLYDNDTARVVSSQSSPSVEKIELNFKKLDPAWFKTIRKEQREAKKLMDNDESIYDRQGGMNAWAPLPNNPKGRLPMVNLYGSEFFLNLRLAEFEAKGDPLHKISWDHVDDSDLHINIWYDATTKQGFTGTFQQAVAHGNVKLITLPPLDQLVREGIARHETLARAGTDARKEAPNKIMKPDTTRFSSKRRGKKR